MGPMFAFSGDHGLVLSSFELCELQNLCRPSFCVLAYFLLFAFFLLSLRGRKKKP